MKELNRIQRELKAPKGQTNNFGKYKYRSCEDILEAVKPLLEGCVLTLSDEVLSIGGRVYVKATASLRGVDKGLIEVSAYAREPEIQKGMNDAQITGSASSYARKYALNGLFCIDDTKDADNMDNSKHETKPKYDNEEAVSIVIKAINACNTQDELAVAEARFNEKTKPYFIKKKQEQHNETILQALDSKGKELG